MKTNRIKFTVASFLGAFLLSPLLASANAPSISQQPTNQAVLAGSNATFSVVATGTSPLFWQWRSTCDAPPIATNNTLTLPAVTTNQSGCTYWVEVTNADGAVTSRFAMLSVLSPSTPDNFNPGANGTVFSIVVQPDGKVVVGGSFTTLAGQSRARIGRLNVDGTLDASFNPGADSSVYSLLMQADGKVLVGGTFSKLGGQSRSCVGRLNSDGTLDDSFNPGADGMVFSLALQQDGMILVGGSFTSLGGQSRSDLGRLNADGTLDTTFSPGARGSVLTLALQEDGRILVGGWFSALGGQSRSYLSRLYADGTLDADFNPGADSAVYSLAVQADGKILASGDFISLGGQSRTWLGRLNADGSPDTDFNPAADNIVNSLAVQADGKILVGGSFATLGGVGRSCLGRLNSDGTLDTNFNPAADGGVYSLAVQADGKILVGGIFSTLGGQSRSYLGRLTAMEPAAQALTLDGSTLTWQRGGSSPEVWRTTFATSTNATSWELLGAGARIAGGWQFSGLAWLTNSLLRARGFVNGGYFNNSGWFVETIIGPPLITNQPASQSVAVGCAATFGVAATGSLPMGYSWLSNGLPVPGATNASYTSDGQPLAASGSQFSCVVSNVWGSTTSLLATLTVLAVPPTITLQPANQATWAGSNAAFSLVATGSLPISCQWRSSCGALVGATNSTLTLPTVTASQSGCTYWAEVTNAYGAITSQVAVLTVLTPSTPDGFNPGASNTVYCMIVQPDGKVVVGGNFTNLAGQGRSRIGRLNADGSLDTGFNPGANSDVYALVSQADGKILVGGTFSKLAGQSRSYIGRLNADGSLDTTFNPGANSYVHCLALQADGKVLVVGYFTALDSQSRSYLGRLNADGTLDSVFNPGPNNSVVCLALQSDGKILLGGDFSMLGGQSRSHIGRINPDGTLDTSFNPGASSTVYSLAVQADNKILVSGIFDTLAGKPQPCLGRLNPDGALDTSFNPGANSYIHSLAIQADGKILLGGDFRTLGGQNRFSLGRLNADGTLDSTFNPGAIYAVYSLAVQTDGRILVGGNFTTLGGVRRSSLGRLTSTEQAIQSMSFDGSTINWQRGGSGPEVWRTTLEATTNGTSWTALGAGERVAGGWRLSGLAWPATALVRARGFTTAGEYNGSGWFTESIIGPPLITSQTTSQTVPVGGSTSFSIAAAGGPPLSYSWMLNNQPITGATNANYSTNEAPLSASGSQFSCVVSNAWGSTTSLVATLTVLPLPPTITQQPANQGILPGSNAIFSVVATGSLPMSYQWRSSCGALADATNAILTIAGVTSNQSGCSYWVEVSNAYGSCTSSVARLTVVAPSTPDTFNPGADGSVYTAAVQSDGKILVGGAFSTLTGLSRSCLGRLNADGTLDTNFSPRANNSVCSLAIQPDGKILVGGNFTTLAGQSRPYLGRLKADGTLDTEFNPGANGTVLSMAMQPDGRILVAGGFSALAGQNRLRLGLLNADGTLDAGFNPSVGGVVYSTAVQADGKILVGGDLTALCSQSRSCLGRLNADGTLDTSFNPGADAGVRSIALQPDGKILLGGSFGTLGGQSRSHVGRLNANGTLDTGFNPGANGAVYSLAVQADGRILVGGAFTTLGGLSCSNLGRLNPDGSPDPAFNPGASDFVYSLTVQVDGRIIAGGYFTTLGGLSRNYLGRLTPTEPATQTLSFDGSTVTWQRGGSSPEVGRTTFDASTNGTDWVALGAGMRIAGGWQFSGLACPTNAILRARGLVSGGLSDGSSWFVETNVPLLSITTQPTSQDVVPNLLPGTLTHFSDGQFQFSLAGKVGVNYEVQVSTNLIDWTQLTVITMTNTPAILLDTNTDSQQRFYRAKSVP